MKPQDPERQYVNDSPLDLSGREGYDTKAASVDETLDKSTLDLLREIEQRVQRIQHHAWNSNDPEARNEIVDLRLLLNQAIVKELSK